MNWRWLTVVPPLLRRLLLLLHHWQRSPRCERITGRDSSPAHLASPSKPPRFDAGGAFPSRISVHVRLSQNTRPLRSTNSRPSFFSVDQLHRNSTTRNYAKGVG